jgi:NAD(P) transhydrogenase subunit alpha
MLTTAAGTITPGRVLIIGVGVAGLQAIATARRLGAVVSAYDVRPAAKEQVLSLGARFVELPIEAKDAQDARGYATAQRMVPGSVIVDLAAERGGNCELTRGSETIVEHGVTSIGQFNLASIVPITRARCARATSQHFC